MQNILISHTVNEDPMWYASYVEEYQAILQNFSDIIVAQLFGHFHSEEFRVDPSWGQTPILLTSAVSPIYGCNPSFRAMSYSRANGTLLDYCVHVATLQSTLPLTWTLNHCAKQQFNLSNFSLWEWQASALRMTASCAALRPFLEVYMEGTAKPCVNAYEWRCLLTTVAQSDFFSCLLSNTTAMPVTTTIFPSPSPDTGRGVSVVAIAISIPLTVLALFGIFFFLHQRRHSITEGYVFMNPADYMDVEGINDGHPRVQPQLS